MNISTDVDWSWKLFLLRREITSRGTRRSPSRSPCRPSPPIYRRPMASLREIDCSLREEFSARGNSGFRKLKFAGARARAHILFYNQRSSNSYFSRTLLVRKRLKCPVRMGTRARRRERRELPRGLVNSRNLERVRRQIIAVSVSVETSAVTSIFREALVVSSGYRLHRVIQRALR